MSLPFAECPVCSGYIIEGTLKRTGMTLSSRCRCEDEPWEQRVEQEIRERQAQPLPDEHLTATVERELRSTMQMQRRAVG
jgi:hypothetical protein